jgi:hypothetical protein
VSSLFFFSFFFLHTMEERPKVSIKVTPKKDVGIVFTLGGDGSASSAVTSTISLRNKSAAAHLAFKVKTNNADKFWVEPKSGFIEPGATVPIRVELRPDHARSVWDGASDPRDFAKDRFLIQSVSVLASEQADMGAGSEEARSSAVNAVFQNADPKTVLNTKRSVSVEVERGGSGSFSSSGRTNGGTPRHAGPPSFGTGRGLPCWHESRDQTPFFGRTNHDGQCAGAGPESTNYKRRGRGPKTAGAAGQNDDAQGQGG